MSTKNKWNIGVMVFFLYLYLLPINTFGQRKQKLYFYAEKGNTVQEGMLKDFKNVSRIYMFYENFFIKGSNFDQNLFNSFCLKLIPSKKEFGYAVLDWEGVEFDILRGVKKVSDQRYNDVLNRFIEIIRYAKKVRPNINWSFYDCNPAQYPFVNKFGVSNAERMAPLLKELDFFSTSLYLRDNFNQSSKINNYLTSNVKESLRLGSIYGKSVLPFVWHRYHDSNRLNDCIAPTDFNKYVQSILKVTYFNKYVDGVIWWNSESYLDRVKAQSKFDKTKRTTTLTALDNQNVLFRNYMNALSKDLSLK